MPTYNTVAILSHLLSLGNAAETGFRRRANAFVATSLIGRHPRPRFATDRCHGSPRWGGIPRVSCNEEASPTHRFRKLSQRQEVNSIESSRCASRTVDKTRSVKPDLSRCRQPLPLRGKPRDQGLGLVG